MLDETTETLFPRKPNQTDMEYLLKLTVLAAWQCEDAFAELEIKHICAPKDLGFHIEMEHSSGSYFHEFWFRLDDGKVVVDGNLFCHGETLVQMFRDMPYRRFFDVFPKKLARLHEDYLDD